MEQIRALPTPANLRVAPTDTRGGAVAQRAATKRAVSRGAKQKGRGAPQLSETLSSLELYSFMISVLRSVSAREIVASTQIPDGTLYPMISKRVTAGLIEASQRDGVAVFSLTAEGYARAAPMLLRLAVTPSAWMRAERHFSGLQGSPAQVRIGTD